MIILMKIHVLIIHVKVNHIIEMEQTIIHNIVLKNVMKIIQDTFIILQKIIVWIQKFVVKVMKVNMEALFIKKVQQVMNVYKIVPIDII